MAVKYKWLAECLREVIQENIGKGIDRLPTEQELCRRYQVSRQTLRSSLSLLEKERLIIKKQGSGSYLTGLSPDSSKNRVKILISSEQDYIYPGLLEDIHNTLSQSGFSVETSVTGNQFFREREILLELLNTPSPYPPPIAYAGIIVETCKSALPNPNLDLYYKLKALKIPVLFLHGCYPALEGCTVLKEDNVSGSALLVRHLSSLGHTAIGGIFQADSQQGTERFRGFMEAMRDTQSFVPDSRISWFHSSDLEKLEKTGDTQFLKNIIHESLEACSAVICHNDIIAHHLVHELLALGFRLPDDMLAVSFDNSYLSSSGALPITSLSHAPHEMGTAAAQMMISKIKGLPTASREIPWKLNIKGTARPKETH